MKRVMLLFAGALLLASSYLQAQAQVFSFSNLNVDIPDNDANGITSVQTINIGSTPIADLTVDLNVGPRLSGTFLGDLYVYLTHSDINGTRTSILMSRVGTRSGNPFGYGDSGGANIQLNDSAANGDVHIYRRTLFGSDTHAIPSPGTLTGTWAPDARTTDPNTVLDTDPRVSSAMLSTFKNQDPSGTWTLFVADLSPGGTARLVSWGLEITAVPEPWEWGMISALMLVGFVIFRNKQWVRGEGFFTQTRRERRAYPR